MSEENGLEISGTVEKGNTKAGPLAKRLIELVKEGRTPEEAARQLGLDPQVMRSNTQLRQQMRNLLASFADIPSQVDKELVRSARRKILMENLEGEGADQKLALKAAKDIGTDPEVGLNLPPAPTINVNLETLEDLFRHMPEKPEVIEAEFTEIKEEKENE